MLSDEFNRKLGSKLDRSGGEIDGNLSMSGDMGLTGSLVVNEINVMDLIPIGSVLAYAGTNEPTNFLFCHGQSLSRADYPKLFASIGTSHGTADDDSFNLPDYRGRFLRGLDGSAGRDPDAATRTAMATGGSTGNTVGTVQNDAFASHNHSTTVYRTNGANPTQNGFGGPTDIDTPRSATIGSTGGNETRPVNAYVNYIIRYR